MDKQHRKIEVLSPAGDMEKLRAAVQYGADAVYLGGKLFSMRSGSKNFNISELYAASTYARDRGVRVYLALNVIPRSGEMDDIREYIEEAAPAVDAFIVADVGVLHLIKKYHSDANVHISTQAGVLNHVSAEMWHKMGASRVVLARELSIEEIKEIREKTHPELELEVFAHGSMCVSFSGRCLLSNYMAARDANHGDCAQPCRWSYYLMEQKRPGEYLPVFEDDRGTYILNARDLCMVEHLDKLYHAGVSSFKIEGRVKTAYYSAVVTGVYRDGTDTLLSDPENYKINPIWRSELEKVSHRPYYTGFYLGDLKEGEYYPDSSYIRDWEVVGQVIENLSDGRTLILQKNNFAAGERLELLCPGLKIYEFTAEDMRDEEGNPIATAPHPHMRFTLPLPANAPPGSFLRKKK